MANAPQLVNIEFATSQLGGNTALLTKMLGKFCNEFAEVPQKVILALAQNNHREAKLKVHTTKGLSGNLGLTALYESSKVLDQQIRDDSIDPSQIEDFERVMQQTISCIKALNLGDVSGTPFTTATHDSSSVENSAQIIAQTEVFIKRLQRNEFIDDDTLHNYINMLALNEAQKNSLKQLVEELQYAKAIEIVKQAL